LFSDEIYLTRLFYFRFSEITLPGSVRQQASLSLLLGACASGRVNPRFGHARKPASMPLRQEL